MAISHISTSIDGLLNQSTSLIGRLLNMDGKVARAKVLELKEKGHKYIPSENCKNFDPLTGCFCDKVKMTEKEAKRLTAIRNGFKNWALVVSEAATGEYLRLEKEMIDLYKNGDTKGTKGTEVLRASQRQLE
jgi:hypothetical protein